MVGNPPKKSYMAELEAHLHWLTCNCWNNLSSYQSNVRHRGIWLQDKQLHKPFNCACTHHFQALRSHWGVGLERNSHSRKLTLTPVTWVACGSRLQCPYKCSRGRLKLNNEGSIVGPGKTMAAATTAFQWKLGGNGDDEGLFEKGARERVSLLGGELGKETGQN